MGSYAMRIVQLKSLLENHPSTRDFTFETQCILQDENAQDELADHLSGAIVICLKNSLPRMSKGPRERLREKARATCMDVVDVDPAKGTLGLYDAYIAASFAGLRQLRIHLHNNAKDVRPNARALHLTHGGDTRLSQLPIRPDPTPYEIAYLGSETSTVFPPQHQERLSVLVYDQNKPLDALKQLAQFPMQYAVRPSSTRRAGTETAHPFTKGFNAALLNQNILVNRQCPDAIHYLGEDYPYLIDDNTSDFIEAGLDYARTSFGSADWKYGLDVMSNFARNSGPDKIAEEFLGIVKTTLDITAPTG